MKTRLLVRLAFVLVKSASPILICSSYAQSDSGALESELKEHLLQIIGDRDQLIAMKPNMSDCLSIGESTYDAAYIYRHVESVYPEIPEKGLVPGEGETELTVKAYRVPELLDDPRNPFFHSLPDKPEPDPDEDALEWLNHLQADTTFYVAWFHEPGKTSDTRVDCLFQVNDRWLWVPFLDSVDFDEEDFVIADLFLSMLKVRRFDDAYAMTTPRVQSHYSLEEFASNTESLGLENALRVAWDSGHEWVNDNFGYETFERRGTLHYEDGSKAQLIVRSMNEGNGWRIVHLEKTAVLGIHPEYAHAPNPEICEKLVRESIAEFIDAIEGPSREALITKIDSFMDAGFNEQDFLETFDTFLQPGYSLDFVSDADFVLTEHPHIEDEDVLQIDARFKNQDALRAVSVNFAYRYHNGEFRLFGLNVGTPVFFNPDMPPIPENDRCMQLAQDTLKEFGSCMSKNDFAPILENSSVMMQERISNEMMQDVFKELAAVPVDFTKLGDESCRLAEEPEWVENMVRMTIAQTIDGTAMHCYVDYIHEPDNGWKLIGINISLDD